MGFIVDSLANIFLETLDTLIIWICDLSASFNLDIGEPGSLFYQTFLERSTKAQETFADFGFGIGALAMLIVLLVTIFKIYQLMADPFTQADSPGSIFLRFIFAGVGVIGSYELFKYFEKGFNAAYQLFTDPYESVTNTFKKRKGYVLQKADDNLISANDNTGSSWNARSQGGGGFTGNATEQDANAGANSGDAFIFGQDKLINKSEAIASHGLALAIIELVVGSALLLCLVKLIFEIYERYVIIAVLYLFSPLAFATIVSRQSTVFKNYLIMVASQFVLMCSNLVFLGVFMRAWYDILDRGANQEYFFENSQTFVTTMLLMIGWLIAGQKLDEHMRSLGLSAAQTGQGIMGAALGSMFMTRAVVGGAIGTAVGAGLGTTGKALTGQTGMQKAWQAGIDSDGKNGGLVGKVANYANPKPSEPPVNMSNAKSFTGGANLAENANDFAKAAGIAGGIGGPQSDVEGHSGITNFGAADGSGGGVYAARAGSEAERNLVEAYKGSPGAFGTITDSSGTEYTTVAYQADQSIDKVGNPQAAGTAPRRKQDPPPKEDGPSLILPPGSKK